MMKKKLMAKKLFSACLVSHQTIKIKKKQKHYSTQFSNKLLAFKMVTLSGITLLDEVMGKKRKEKHTQVDYCTDDPLPIIDIG